VIHQADGGGEEEWAEHHYDCRGKRSNVSVCVCVCVCVSSSFGKKVWFPLNAHHGPQTKESLLIQQNKSFVCVCVLCVCVCIVWMCV